jgi:hypothetical protein
MAVRISSRRMRVKWAALGSILLFGGCGGEGPTAPASSPAPGSPPVVTVAAEGWAHVAEGFAVVYQANPPASGPHYPVWARYREHARAIARPYWVHNLEHGAIVLLYRPDAPAAAVQELRQAFSALPDDPACGHRRALMTPDPLLPQPVAAVAAFHVLMAERLDPSWVRAFTDTYRGRGPEAICADGTLGYGSNTVDPVVRRASSSAWARAASASR